MLTLLETILVILVIAMFLTLALLLIRAHRQLHTYEAHMRSLVPAYVDSTLALVDGHRTIRDVLSLVPMPPAAVQKRSDEELNKHIDEALAQAEDTPPMLVPEIQPPFYAPVIPLRRRDLV